MPAGRPPKPTERKRRNGQPGHHPVPESKGTLVAADGVPPVPETLDEVGTEAWTRLWGAAHIWLSPETDHDLLVRLCEALQDRAVLRRVLMSEGWFQWKPNASGTGQELVSHPVADRLDKLDTKILQMESRAGFTPTDRVRLGVEVVRAEKARSDLEDIQARAAQRRRSA